MGAIRVSGPRAKMDAGECQDAPFVIWHIRLDYLHKQTHKDTRRGSRTHA